jgi:hypothetical protein
MTPEKQMEIMQQDIHDIKKNVDEIKNVLVGNQLANDGGLIKRISDLEKEMVAMKKNTMYLNLLWAALGVIGTAVIMFLFNKIFKP